MSGRTSFAPTPWRSETGSVSVVAAVVVGITLICCMGVSDVAKALVARSHAQAAADAAALAAAQELALSGVDPSDVASEYAVRNGATLTSCDCDLGGSEATVKVSLPVGGFLLLPDDRTVTAAARAVVESPDP